MGDKLPRGAKVISDKNGWNLDDSDAEFERELEFLSISKTESDRDNSQNPSNSAAASESIHTQTVNIEDSDADKELFGKFDEFLADGMNQESTKYKQKPQASNSSSVPNTSTRIPPGNVIISDVNATNETVNTLKSMFPDLSSDDIVSVLEVHNYSLERAADYLLMNPVLDSTSNSNVEELDADTRAALERVAQYEKDEKLAAEMQYKLLQNSAPRREVQRAQPSRVRPSFTPLSVTLDSPQTMEREMSRIESIFPDAVEQQLIRGLEFPDTTGQTTALSSTIDYGMFGIELVSFKIPSISSGTLPKVQLYKDCVYTAVSGIDLVLNIARWNYEKKGTPRIADTGSCQAFLDGTHLGVTLTPQKVRKEDGNEEEIVWKPVECNVSVENVRVVFGTSKASWLYNALSVLFVDKIGILAEKALQKCLVDNIVPTLLLRLNGTLSESHNENHPSPVGTSMENPIDI